MTDLTYCYLHMSNAEIETLDKLEDPDYWEYTLSEEELQIPFYMIPPDPDESESLPSHVHISYPYGDPTKLNHPSAQANRPLFPNSRTIYDDGGSEPNVNVSLIWKELALEYLLPTDPAKEEAERAAMARRLANGVQANPDDPHGTAENEENDSANQDEDTVEEDQNDENDTEADSSE